MREAQAILDSDPARLRDESLGRQLLEVQERFMRLVDGCLATAGLGQGQLAALDAIADADGGISPGLLARRLGCSRSNVTALVTRLEKLSFVARVADGSDRRAKLIAITREGRKALARAKPRHHRAMKLAFRGMDNHLRAALSAALERIAVAPVPTDELDDES